MSTVGVFGFAAVIPPDELPELLELELELELAWVVPDDDDDDDDDDDGDVGDVGL